MGNRGEVVFAFVLIVTAIIGTSAAIQEKDREHKLEIHNIVKHRENVLREQELKRQIRENRSHMISM